MVTQLTIIFPQVYDHKDTFTAGGGLTLALATSLMGCNRDKMTQELPQPSETAAQAQANQELAALAKALARTLGADAAARQALKAEALKKFDGDYDVLYQPFAAGHAAFGQHVAEAIASTSPAGLTMPALLGRIPSLNLSVPVNIDKWDTATYAPLVIFIPAGYDERTATRVKAYDQDGNVRWLDAKKAPGFPVVVVGPSERISTTLDAAQPISTQTNTLRQPGTATSNAIDEPEPTTDPGTPPTGTGGPGPQRTTASSCRTDKQTEYLRSMHLEDVSEYEAWILGDPEIKLQIKGPLGANGGVTLYSALFTMSRSDIENTWFPDAQLYYWDKSVTADAVMYYWLEQDGGQIGTVTLGLEYTFMSGPKASGNVSFPIGSDDDEISYKAMNFDFCPLIGYYSISKEKGEFRWQLDNRPYFLRPCCAETHCSSLPLWPLTMRAGFLSTLAGLS